ncbi:MAG: class 1 fructose-bisphosphatase [Alphaproteobacteria bacterium]|nr:class 1 fructose-bisphosphatase [Alphaproteobacteria bacterium]
MTAQTLKEFLEESGQPVALRVLIEAVSDSCRSISALVARGALADVLGAAGTGNVQGEEQKTLDVLCNDEMMTMAKACGVVAGAASEEEEHPALLTAGAPYLLLFDPLDGSSNIDVNVSIGTIFSVLPRQGGPDGDGDASFLRPGRDQVAAGYAIYGPQTMLVLTLGAGVAGFTLDPPTGQWLLTSPAMRIPATTGEFAINMSNMRHWADPVRGYVEACLAGATGERGKDFNMRWIACMVADVHRVLSRGGVFLYPWDKREPSKPGKLRLMYEGNPMSFLVEQAGGRAIDGTQNILDIQPSALHQRVSVMLGCSEEVDLLETAHR